ncbi:MAG TPA: hypothetical protein VES01_09910 [Dermatophilaceae bacterium]|nr:hypothetical protein [Dermatophilaceae bacterium]
MARVSVDAQVVAEAGAQLARAGADLGVLALATTVSLGRIGLSAGDVGVAGAAVVAQRTWRTALQQVAEGTARAGAAAALAAHAYRDTELVTAGSFESRPGR